MVETDVQIPDDDAILKEMFVDDNVRVRTQLNHMQVESVSKLETLAVIFNNPLLKQHLNNFMKLQKSLDRQSLKEFVEGLKGKHEALNKGKGFFNNMLG